MEDFWRGGPSFTFVFKLSNGTKESTFLDDSDVILSGSLSRRVCTQFLNFFWLLHNLGSEIFLRVIAGFTQINIRFEFKVTWYIKTS